MTKPQEKYHINGNLFLREELLIFSEKESHNSQSWKKEIFKFIHEWLCPGDTILVKTSGSTGVPGEIKFKKWQLIESALRTGKFFNLKSGDKALLCIPANTIAGKLMIVRSMVIGMDLHFTEPTGNPLENLSNIFDFAAMTPYQVSKSIADENNLDSINKIIIGGGKISNDLLGKIQETKSNCYATYGMTETITHIAVQKLNGDNKQHSFKTMPDIQIRLDKRECLCIKAPYLENEIITNDIVSLINNESFTFKGRYDNVVNSGGIKLFPEEIENLLEGIIDLPFYISSEPDDELGEKVILVIEGVELPKQEVNNLKNKLRSKLSTFQVPRKILFVYKFQRTESGKIIRQNNS